MEHTLGKPIENVNEANPARMVTWTWHATKDGKPVIYVDYEQMEPNLVKFGPNQIKVLDKIHSQVSKEIEANSYIRKKGER